MSHLTPAHHETSKLDSPNELKIKEKQKQNYPGFELKPCHVNDSSQSNQVTVHLVSQKVIFGPDLIDEAEATVHRIQNNLKVMKSRQESYVNKRRRPFEFKVGDHVYLRVSLMKGVKRFRVKGKLAPRYIGSFPILKKCRTVTLQA
jgi:hypothetical protein